MYSAQIDYFTICCSSAFHSFCQTLSNVSTLLRSPVVTYAALQAQPISTRIAGYPSMSIGTPLPIAELGHVGWDTMHSRGAGIFTAGAPLRQTSHSEVNRGGDVGIDNDHLGSGSRNSNGMYL